MTLNQITKLLKELNSKNFVRSRRKGPTGVGHTFEQELNLKENNIPIPDIGGRVELKTSRKNSNTLVTLLTFNRAAWVKSQREVIEKYGYLDKEHGRKALYNITKVNEINSQGLTLKVDVAKQIINLIHSKGNELLANWSIYTIVGKFLTKLDKLIFVTADSKLENNVEYFHYYKAVLLTEPTAEKFLDAFNKGIVCIDLRMHLRDNNSVRNHGTGFRVIEANLPDLYSKKKELM